MARWSVVRCAMLWPILLCTGMAAGEEAGKGHRILLERGFQIQGMATKDDVFHLQTYSSANYTAINWLWEANPAHHGPRPGFPWARWVGDPSQMPPRTGTDEAPYMSQLVALSLGDEKDLNDPAVREPYIEWFNSVRGKYPEVIFYANNYGGQVNDAALADFVARGRPDMLAFDTYPWRSNYQTRKPAPPAGGSPTQWYSDLRRYREHARAAKIPLATYRQSFHAVQDYDSTVYRDPSPSEFRLNTFAALAFNVKFLIDFTYNTGASSYFTTPGGDTHPTPLYQHLRQVNREVLNLGPVLVRLTPIDDVSTPGQHTTSMMFIRGRHATGPGASAANPLPVGFAPDPAAPEAYSEWEPNRNDPYLRGWTVTNIGTKNDGLPGDVIIAWFRVLDESLDGEQWNDQVYMMVVNGLSAGDGSADQTRQRITLNFVNHPETEILQKLDRETGRLRDVPLLPRDGRRQFVFELDGGTAELVRFKTGGPFVGADSR